MRAFFILIFTLCSIHSLYATDPDSTTASRSQVDIPSILEELGLSPHENVDTALILFVYEWVGTKYCYGGQSKNGVDCSGFANVLYEQVFGIELVRVSTDIYHKSKKVKKKNLEQGNLVFFKTNGRSRVNHVGVYLWDGYFVHASTKRGVIISKLDEGYYEKTFVSGGRMD
ncbi:hypothetical protein GYB22_11730 [bacterium]|nr:hypothetical protein [bacterium]